MLIFYERIPRDPSYKKKKGVWMLKYFYVYFEAIFLFINGERKKL